MKWACFLYILSFQQFFVVSTSSISKADGPLAEIDISPETSVPQNLLTLAKVLDSSEIYAVGGATSEEDDEGDTEDFIIIPEDTEETTFPYFVRVTFLKVEKKVDRKAHKENGKMMQQTRLREENESQDDKAVLPPRFPSGGNVRPQPHPPSFIRQDEPEDTAEARFARAFTILFYICILMALVIFLLHNFMCWIGLCGILRDNRAEQLPTSVRNTRPRTVSQRPSFFSSKQQMYEPL